MARIRVLPEVLAHQIAAGEIVERPASVIKELLENALHADASRIAVDALDGGCRRMCVRDNGRGMGAEDAQLAFHRHATSKISELEDLSRIRTLGFRGEALPSIASVSRLRLRTVDSEDLSRPRVGTLLEFEGGVLKKREEIAWPEGTEILVDDLFFNVPARRKFLKATSTELSHLSRQVQCYALAYPETEFQLRHNQRPLLEAPAVGGLRERAFQLLGESFLDNLAPVSFEKEGVRVEGFTSLPHEQKSNASGQFLFVNRRMVRDKVLTHAIRLAYQDLIPASSHPTLILLIELDPALLDVNVHPAKTEVRFRQSNSVHSAVYHGIEEALLRHRSGGLGSLARPVPHQQLQGLATGAADSPESWHRQGVARSLGRYFGRQTATTPLFTPPPPSGGPSTDPSSAQGPQLPPRTPGQESPGEGWLPSASGNPHGDEIPETAHLSNVLTVLGQFVESFIVAADRDGVLLIDQHVAHERILYDQALGNMEQSRTVPTQGLLLPITLELNAQQKLAMEGVMDELRANGFDVDWFGDRTVVIKGVPQVATHCEAGELIESVLDDLSQGRREPDTSGQAVRRLREKVAISLSCRAAIKINTPLSMEKMRWLLDELMRCRNPYTCPHGRPIILRMQIEDVLRGFHRI